MKTADLRDMLRASRPMGTKGKSEPGPSGELTPPDFRWPYWTRDALIGLAVAASILAAWWIVIPMISRSTHSATKPGISAPVTPQTEAQAGPTGAPLLWVVKTGHATVYLFGSVHMLRPNLDWMDPRLFKAFDTADQAWFEVPDLDKLPPFKGFEGRAMASRPVLTKGLSVTEQAQLETVLNHYNFTTHDLARVKPWAVAQMIAQMDADGGNFSVEKGADFTLFHRARALKIKTDGFEGNRLHYSYIYALRPDLSDTGTDDLKRALASHFGNANQDDDINVIVKVWRNGDEKALTESLARDEATDPRVNQILLHDRNAKWMPQIETLLKSRSTVFITVGINHLIGPDGLVAQLRGRGYLVTRIDPA